ncbi:MAG: DUF547 domain-containing protein [Alphaproteobacteria bacterium]|nr:DUF547 domain-containing protein [Alphaproteobacteria bacterium]
MTKGTIRPGVLVVACVAVSWLLPVLSAWAAPKAELWRYWQVHDPASRIQVDHRPWQGFLDRFVVRGPQGVNLVRYAAVDQSGKRALKGYIAALARVPVRRLNRSAQRAYWINLYNALTIDVVLAHMPVTSIRDIDISPGWFSRGPWGAKLVTIDGKRISLDEIEHRILRPIWRDPRVHYALNCASMGCPEISERAFTPANTEARLDRAARRFVNHPRAVRFQGGRLVVSSLYHWYGDDFGAGQGDILAHIRSFAAPSLARRLDGIRSFADGGYDWSLNAAP